MWGIAIRKSESAGASKPPPIRRTRSHLLSPIARLILASNLAGVVILTMGALYLNELRSDLVDARKASLYEMAEILSSVLTEQATVSVSQPRLLERSVRYQLKRMALNEDSRIRVFDSDGKKVADTWILSDQIAEQELPPIRKPGSWDRFWLDTAHWLKSSFEGLSPKENLSILEARSLQQEVETAMRGDAVFSERFGDNAERVISVTVPIKIVGAVVGTLTLETSDVARIIAAERAALIPFIVVAVLVAIITSTLLTLGIARPLRRLSQASDRVRIGAAMRLNLGALHQRKDEIGDLARAMEAMTATLYDRIQANERFAADVAHELKNPLTSIRSAVETSQAVADPAVRERMLKVVADDVRRLDRLITDISNLSRLEGEIARETPVRVNLMRLIEDLTSMYQHTRKDNDPRVTMKIETMDASAVTMGHEGPLAQVLRNLIENARSFSPPDGEVRVTLGRTATLNGLMHRITVDDQGRGVPVDKLEKIFERFYSDRPAGAKFGNNSGLGLSIVKQIVETHRGKVWAENRMEDGRIAGARFIVELPFVPDTQ
ncbi:MAG: stimulus-sensing domain-containing protein [Hyphomonadaceae bacterium]